MTKNKPRIFFIRTDMEAPSYYRIYLPFLEFQEKGYEVKLDPPVEELPSADIIVASSIVSYKSIQHGKTGYLARNLSDWESYLVELKISAGKWVRPLKSMWRLSALSKRISGDGKT